MQKKTGPTALTLLLVQSLYKRITTKNPSLSHHFLVFQILRFDFIGLGAAFFFDLILAG
ncbi:hypothetical protein IWQ55_001784 [Labrenzia sp. EL_208]|nr:hypothetical protein [Labrenzia sp. EL_132]MBG6228579.1 hypothetical protein [Labrenzia sp. EL_208]